MTRKHHLKMTLKCHFKIDIKKLSKIIYYFSLFFVGTFDIRTLQSRHCKTSQKSQLFEDLSRIKIRSTRKSEIPGQRL